MAEPGGPAVWQLPRPEPGQPGPAALLRALTDLAGAATDDRSADELLRQLVVVARQALCVEGVGVMGGSGTDLRFVHAQPATLAGPERAQEALDAAPCRQSLAERGPLVVEDVAADPRWPRYSDAARAAGMRSVLAVPLLARGRGCGVLDLYRSTPGPWPDAQLSAARVLADVAASFLALAADRDLARSGQQQLAHRVMHDELTGLPNRALLFDRLDHALDVARRRATTVGVLFLDLDRFKAVNDSLGHEAGDALLVEVASRLTATLRAGDTLARLGGDEFVLVCEAPAGGGEPAGQLDVVAARVRAALAPVFVVVGHELSVSASIGAVLADAGRHDSRSLLRDADRAMYAAKPGSAGAPRG